MSTLCKTYSDEAEAREAVERLLAEGAPRAHVSLLTTTRMHDVRRETVGGFAGPVPPDAPVGTFGDVHRLRRQGRGAFAGDPDRQRQGSFGDVDRDVIVTFGPGVEHLRTATRRRLRRLLRAVTIEGEPDDALLDELHAGHQLVLEERDPDTPTPAA